MTYAHMVRSRESCASPLRELSVLFLVLSADHENGLAVSAFSSVPLQTLITSSPQPVL